MELPLLATLPFHQALGLASAFVLVLSLLALLLIRRGGQKAKPSAPKAAGKSAGKAAAEQKADTREKATILFGTQTGWVRAGGGKSPGCWLWGLRARVASSAAGCSRGPARGLQSKGRGPACNTLTAASTAAGRRTAERFAKSLRTQLDAKYGSHTAFELVSGCQEPLGCAPLWVAPSVAGRVERGGVRGGSCVCD